MARERYLVGVKPEELLPPPPPEQPKTLQDKLKNFWYHYKWPTIAVAGFVLVVIFLSVQLMSRDKYDYTLIVVTEQPMQQTTLEEIDRAFSAFGSDRDGNGEVAIRVQNLAMNEGQGQAELSAYLSSGEAVFFAMESSYYTRQIVPQENDDYHFFTTLANGERYWDWRGDMLQTDSTVPVPSSMYFGVRSTEKGSTAERNAEEAAACKALLDAYIAESELISTAP